jgi:hexosaminidase
MKFFYFKTKVVQFVQKWWNRFFGTEVIESVAKISEERTVQEEYAWRGLMIDTARHMPSVEWLRHKVDEMSLLGLNKLHLHLSDDQGWRVEIKQYPQLQQVAAWRRETVVGKNFPAFWDPFRKYVGDGKRYGGYYTQAELKSLVAYAKSKGVEIVPEIDLPGHLTALLVAYPQYAAGHPPQEVTTYWGVFKNVLANTPEAIRFIKNILDEICEIFSSHYIHLGGDEVPLDNYGSNEKTPKKILEEAGRHLIRKGRCPVFWDEAADVALRVGGVVMAWHSLEEGLRILEEGGRVIFCPTSHFYFDFYQRDPSGEPLAIGGYLPLSQVYDFRVSEEVRGKHGERVMGVQANLWTEYMPSEAQMDYMLYPRLYALAEVAKGENTDFERFASGLWVKNLV